MRFFEIRRLKKTAHLARHLVRHALDMREDIAPAGDVAAARAAEAVLDAARAARDWDRLAPACDAARTLGIRARGGFAVSDPADPSVSADGAQADILTGKIALAGFVSNHAG